MINLETTNILNNLKQNDNAIVQPVGIITCFPKDIGNRMTGWIPCQGQKYKITQFRDLYNLIGTNFGGDGTTYFYVPDMGSASPYGASSSSELGNKGGTSNVSAHTHSFSPTFSTDHDHDLTHSINSHSHTIGANYLGGTKSVERHYAPVASSSSRYIIGQSTNGVMSSDAYFNRDMHTFDMHGVNLGNTLSTGVSYSSLTLESSSVPSTSTPIYDVNGNTSGDNLPLHMSVVYFIYAGQDYTGEDYTQYW